MDLTISTPGIPFLAGKPGSGIVSTASRRENDPLTRDRVDFQQRGLDAALHVGLLRQMARGLTARPTEQKPSSSSGSVPAEANRQQSSHPAQPPVAGTSATPGAHSATDAAALRKRDAEEASRIYLKMAHAREEGTARICALLRKADDDIHDEVEGTIAHRQDIMESIAAQWHEVMLGPPPEDDKKKKHH